MAGEIATWGQGSTPIGEIQVLWINAGLSCDGDTIAMTAATENDARRLARSQAPVKQIITGTVCHLDAEMVREALAGWNLAELDFLFIENVGNLVCPSSYDLGEHLRLVLMSVTEGEDKPLKYPTIFNGADVAVITKTDLAEAVEFDWAAAQANIDSVRPGLQILRLSAKNGCGMDQWLEFVSSRMLQTRAANLVASTQSLG